jgi:hypothetical protein
MKKLKRPNFYQIPELVASSVKPHDSFVFSVIYWFEKMKDGRCFASNETISEALPYKSSSGSVANSLVKLEKAGFIKRIFEDKECRIRKEIKCLVDFGVSSTDEGGITHRLRGVSSTDEQNNNNIIIRTNNISVLEFWNSKGITKHKESPDILKVIDKALKNFDQAEIEKGISNYAEIYLSEKTYFKHKWTLTEFLSRKNGLAVFIFKTTNDYLKSGINEPAVYKNTNGVNYAEKLKEKQLQK